MALTFPMSIAQFWGLLRIAGGAQFTLGEARQFTRTRGGHVLVADRGARLWQGSVDLADNYTHAQAVEVLALIDVLANAGGSFLCFEMPKCRPGYDPTGSILGAASPTINALNVNARELRVQGLPAGYQLRAGDMLEIRTAGAVRSLHRVVVGATANGAGLTPEIEVVPRIRPGAAVNGAVTLIKPAMTALIEPGSIRTGSIGQRYRSGMGFSFMQTVRPL